MAAWCGLRLGECAGLQRSDVDALHGTVSVTKQVQRSKRQGGFYEAEPKTAAGRRVVTMPRPLVDEMTAHLAAYVGAEPDAYVFAGERGGTLVRGNWCVEFRDACEKVGGLTSFHFHDLRHSGNTLAAATGASLADLMARMGHASPRAALRYQHATATAQSAIADALGRMMEHGADEGSRATVHKLAPRKTG